MSLRLPLVDLPGGTYQEPAVERKIVVVRKSSAAEMVGPPSKRPAELVVYTNPPKSISPPLVSPFNQKTRMSLSGFMLFVRKERNTISEKYPNASQEQLTAIYQKHWNALDKGMQATLNSQAHELNLRLGNVSPHSPPDVVKENEGDLSKIIQVAHATPQVPRPAISRETIDRLQTVASSLGLKRKMSATVERGVLTPATGSTTRAVRPPQQQTAAATANNGLSAAAALEFYYLSLCQPAFPEAGEPPLTPAPPQFYLDQWQMLEWQRREGGAQRL